MAVVPVFWSVSGWDLWQLFFVQPVDHRMALIDHQRHVVRTLDAFYMLAISCMGQFHPDSRRSAPPDHILDPSLVIPVYNKNAKKVMIFV